MHGHLTVKFSIRTVKQGCYLVNNIQFYERVQNTLLRPDSFNKEHKVTTHSQKHFSEFFTKLSSHGQVKIRVT